MKVNTILFPSSFFDGKKVDEDLQSEYEAALNTGRWDTVFFNYDKWFNEGELVLSEEISERIYDFYVCSKEDCVKTVSDAKYYYQKALD